MQPEQKRHGCLPLLRSLSRVGALGVFAIFEDRLWNSGPSGQLVALLIAGFVCLWLLVRVIKWMWTTRIP
jgi:hypothetical protein